MCTFEVIKINKKENIFNKIWYNRKHYFLTFLTYSLMFFTLLSITEIYGVNAESGTITTAYETSLFGQSFGAEGANENTNFSLFAVDFTHYNSISRYRITLNTNSPFPDEANSTSFTIVSGATGSSGYVYYSKSDKNITWVFPNDILITSNVLRISYSTPIFNGWVLTRRSTENPDINRPLCLTTVNGNCAILTTASLDKHEYLFAGAKTLINYNVTYDGFGNYITQINKSISVLASKIILHSETITQLTESSFNLNSFTSLNPHLDGIYINVTMSNGGFNNVLINSTNILSSSNLISGNLSIPKLQYNKTESVNISYNISINSSVTNQKIKIRLPTIEVINNFISDGNGQYFNFYIPYDYPIGNYTVYLQYEYLGSWFTLDTKYFNVGSTDAFGNVISDVKFLFDTYDLSQTLNALYYTNQSGYINILDGSNNIKYNTSSLIKNASTEIDYHFKQSDSTGTWIINLYNSTGNLLSSDTTYINFGIVPNPTDTPIISSTSTPTSLLDVANQLSEVAIGKVTNDNGEVDDVQIHKTGNKIYTTLLMLVIIIFVFSAYHKIKGR